jgi:hypothetical protein
MKMNINNWIIKFDPGCQQKFFVRNNRCASIFCHNGNYFQRMEVGICTGKVANRTTRPVEVGEVFRLVSLQIKHISN